VKLTALAISWAIATACTPSRVLGSPIPQTNSTAKSTTVARTTKAVNYRRANGSIKASFRGTELQGGTGEAKVENRNNRMEIEAKFAGLEDSTKFGLEYLTYVFWAVSPQGRAENLGEVVVKNGSAHVKAITDMQTFGMIVTAEPYFAVTQPGDVVVLEAIPAADGTSRVENVDATYELIGRGAYSSSNTRIEGAIFGIDPHTPRELFEARNAIRIARNAGADKYATATLEKAGGQLAAAEEAYRSKRDRKTVESAARDVVETAEEARVMAVKQKAEEEAQARIAAEKKAAEEREAKARADADAEARRRQEAEQARKEAEEARVQAEQAKVDAERMKQQAELAAQEAARQKDEAEKARQSALEQQRLAESETAKARQAVAKAESEKAQLRAQILDQLNSILQTRDSARGLIVNMSDVLFDPGSSTLKPGAREKLAKISGILLAHPGLTLQIEGHTDIVGSDEFNQQLSERRSDTVRDYLAEQGVPASSMTAKGFGKSQPVASNDTPEGRQRNRRVELVVNGDAIGKTAAAGTAVSAATPQ
jgi:outer membrane protein OmpA-like peptidoglycan-associated protein